MRSKPVIIILATVFLVAYCRLTLDYVKQRQEQAALTTQIADAREMRTQIPEPPANLEESLAAAEAKLGSAQRLFPTRLNSTQVINYILELARQHDVTAIPLVTRAWSTEKV